VVRHTERRPTITHDTGATATTARPDPIPALTGLRIVGAAWVFSLHFQHTIFNAFPQLRIFEPLFSRGELGVPLFFVLSGFIIWHNYGSRSLLAPRPTLRFLWRRFARLWPVNVATALLILPVTWWSVTIQGNFGDPIPDWLNVGDWLRSVFMVYNIGQAELSFAWNGPAWSLSAEMVAYLVFPVLLALLLASRATRLRMTWIWAPIALLLAYAIFDRSVLFPSRWLVELILMFTVGVLLRMSGIARGWVVALASVVQVAAPAAIVLVCYVGGGQFLVALLGAWIWSLAAPRGPGVWLFSLRGLQVAGLSSYSLYMLHGIVIGYGTVLLVTFPSLQTRLLPWYAVGLVLALCVASWASYRFYETPARKLLNRVFERMWPRRVDPDNLDGFDVSQTEIVGVEDVRDEHSREGTDRPEAAKDEALEQAPDKN